MDRLLEDAFVFPRQGGNESRPAMDVYEEGDNLVVEAHVFSVKSDGLDVNVEHGMLTINGQTRARDEHRARHYLVGEQRCVRFGCSLRLLAAYDAAECKADIEHGTLRSTFPQFEAAKPRRIQIGGRARRFYPVVRPARPSGGRSESRHSR
jgi:HSP20 family protein